MNGVKIRDVTVGKNHPLTLISGPCVIESEEHTLLCAEKLIEITSSLPIQLIFKASYDKANRSSYRSFRGPGLKKGLSILQQVKDHFHIPVCSDVHLPEEVDEAAEVLDLLQIPAFLCRQTDLLIKAAQTGKPLHIKKGQFVAPWDMKNAVEKARSVGNSNVILCERGATFGYNNLVTDMRSLAIMRGFNVPVIFDATHSVQLPGSQGESTGGQREFIPLLARSAVAAGVDGLFMETHTAPQEALSDSSVVVDLAELKALLQTLLAIHAVVQKGLS